MDSKQRAAALAMRLANLNEEYLVEPLEDALHAEREACAQIAVEFGAEGSAAHYIGTKIAAAIRGRE